MLHLFLFFLKDAGFDASELEGQTTGVIRLRILGMTCASCVHLIESKVSQMPGVSKASVSLGTERGEFTADSDKIGPRDLIKCVTFFGGCVFVCVCVLCILWACDCCYCFMIAISPMLIIYLLFLAQSTPSDFPHRSRPPSARRWTTRLQS